MDLDKIEARARGLKTRAELEQLLQNALAKKELEAARLVGEVLAERFPSPSNIRRGATPTEARFKDSRESFPSGKEAYLWLLEQLRLRTPSVLETYSRLQARRRRIRGRRFARSVTELFPPGSQRIEHASHHAELGGGWFTDVNLDHQDKFAVLLSLSQLSGLQYPVDWDFRPIGGTAELEAHQAAVVRAEEIVAELLRGDA
jgi:hypothetical protein